MTAITRASSALDAIVGRSISSAKKLKVAKYYLFNKGVDTSVMTNEEIAESFLGELFTLLKHAHSSALTGEAKQANAQAVADAQATAETDFD